MDQETEEKRELMDKIQKDQKSKIDWKQFRHTIKSLLELIVMVALLLSCIAFIFVAPLFLLFGGKPLSAIVCFILGLFYSSFVTQFYK